MTTKLIMIEGIPGVGKSSIAKFVKTILDKGNHKSELFNEGNLNHVVATKWFGCHECGDVLRHPLI